MSASCFILYPTRLRPGIALAHLDEALTPLGMSVTKRPASLLVQWNEGPKFKVSLASGAEVLAESAEIAEAFAPERADRDRIAACDARVELSFDLEKALDESNTLIELQLTLQTLLEGWIFTQWNGQLVGPKDPT